MLKDQGAETQMNLWKARLSHSKQNCQKQLPKHDGFASRLNALQDIPELKVDLRIMPMILPYLASDKSLMTSLFFC